MKYALIVLMTISATTATVASADSYKDSSYYNHCKKYNGKDVKAIKRCVTGWESGENQRNRAVFF